MLGKILTSLATRQAITTVHPTIFRGRRVDSMYAYCSNNPIMYVDYTGEMGIALAGKALASAGPAGLIVLGVLVVVAVGIVVYSCSTDGSVTEDELRNLMGR